MTRLITVSGGKGGVGKTTVTSNLGYALSEMGVDAVVVDANLTNPNLGFHLGIPLYPVTLHDVLKDEAHITEATYIHNSGLRVVPAGISVDDLRETAPGNLKEVLKDTIGEPEIVLIDCAAGLGSEAVNAIEASDEVLLVTNPNLPAVTDALKTASIAEDSGTHVLGTVLNRHEDKEHELKPREVEEMVGHPVVSVFPEEDIMKESVTRKSTVIDHDPDHIISHKFRGLAADIAGLDYEMPDVEKGLMNRIRNMLGLK